MQLKYQASHSFIPYRVWRVLAGAACAALLLASAAPLRAAEPTPTRVSLESATAPTGGGFALTATVTTTTGEPVSGGTVDFVEANGQSLGSAVVSDAGVATLTLATLPPASTTSVDGSGSLPLVAEFHAPAAEADAAAYSDAHSTLTAVADATTTPTSPFTVTANPTTLTVTAGNYGATTLTVASQNKYAGSIEFSCSGLPAQVTCAFNPTQQNLTANGSFSTTLQIATQGTSGAQTSSLWRGEGGIAMALLLPGGLLLFAFSGRRRLRSLQMLGVALLCAGAGLGLSGCSQRYGYLHHPPLTAIGTPAGTYTITVAVDGTQGSSAIENDLSINLVVK